MKFSGREGSHTSAGRACGGEWLTRCGLKIEEGLPKWAEGAVCGGTSLHSASCDQSHDSRTRMMPAVRALQADTVAVAGALPMCNAPNRGTTSRRMSVPTGKPHRWSAHGAAGGAGSEEETMNNTKNPRNMHEGTQSAIPIAETHKSLCRTLTRMYMFGLN